MRTHVVVFAVSLSVLASLDARPCGNAVYRLKQNGIAKLMKAERVLKEGNPRKAIRLIHRLKVSSLSKKVRYYGADQLYLDSHDVVLREMSRRDRIVALAVARLDGRFDAHGKKVKGPLRRMILTQAAGTLKPTGKVRAAPVRYAHYAQALERLHDNSGAHKIFSELDRAGLLNTSWSLASFARVAGNLGDDVASAALIERCKNVAGKRARDNCSITLTAIVEPGAI